MFWIWFIIASTIVYDFRDEIIHHKYLSPFFPHAGYTEMDGEVVYRKSENGHFLITAKVNDHQIKFLMDTGASDILLSEDDAIKANLDLSSPSEFRLYETANGKVKLGVYKVDKIELSDEVYMENVTVTVGTNSSSSLLGMNFLKHFKFSVSKDKVTIYPYK